MESRVLIDEAAIARRVAELAKEIAGDLPDQSPMVVGLLTGSFVFMADLVRAASRLGIQPEVDFMAVSHYGATMEASGIVEVHKQTSLDVRGHAVLLVDDILDTGRTLSLVRDRMVEREPAWIRTCVFLDKPSRREVDVTADYVGFEVPDVWVVGYGLDAAGAGRELPYIMAVEPDEDRADETDEQ